jgi:hypothetical protein
VPQDRAGRLSTELFERYQRSEGALVAALAEMVLIEGWDCPEMACMALARPTKSLGLWKTSLDNAVIDAGIMQLARGLRDEFAPMRQDQRALFLLDGCANHLCGDEGFARSGRRDETDPTIPGLDLGRDTADNRFLIGPQMWRRSVGRAIYVGSPLSDIDTSPGRGALRGGASIAHRSLRGVARCA